MDKRMYASVKSVQVFLSPGEKGCTFEVWLAMASIQWGVRWSWFATSLYVTKYTAAALNDSDAPFRTATFSTHSLEGTFMTRWLVWLCCGQDPYLIASSANGLFAETGLFL